MKNKYYLLLILLILGVFFTTNTFAVPSLQNMQSVWMSTVFNIDFPSTKNNISAQKNEYLEKLDELKAIGINTVVVQVRPKADALYKSNINPWSDVLTGTQGKNPGYDPMGFMIKEAHKRGMAFHAWLNPYRVTTSGTDLNALCATHPARLNPHWVISYNNALYYNPELEEVKEHIVQTVAEIVNNYDVDAIHFDDYFYPSHYPLPQGEGKDGTVAYSRRQNINDMIERVGTTIKNIKSDVFFGVSPLGIWRNNTYDSDGSNTSGNESYYSVYADTRAWIKNEWIDYVVPQIYWETGNKSADYETLVKWWANEVRGTKVKLFIGQGIYKDVVAQQIDTQLKINEKYPEIYGSFYYGLKNLLANNVQCKEKIAAYNKMLSKEVSPGPWSNDFKDSSRSADKIGTVTANILNIRSGNSLHYNVVTKVTKGTKVTVLTKKSDWYYVRLSDGQTGWASEEYISLQSASPDNSSPSNSETDSKYIKLKYNGAEVNFPDARPYIDENNRTQIPIRSIAELMKFDVSWEKNEGNNAISLTKDNIIVELKIGDKTAVVNGVQHNLDTCPALLYDRTYVPLRFLSVLMGNEIDWDYNNNTVLLSEKIEKADITDIGKQSGTTILSAPRATVEQAKEWAALNGATDVFIALADIVWEKATAAGVDPTVVYCQSAKETGYGRFGGTVDETFKNPCGLKNIAGGSDGDKGAYQRFATWEEGIQAQVDHLALYAGAPGYPKMATPDPKHFSSLNGIADTVEKLTGTWASLPTYGTELVKMMIEVQAVTI